MELSKEYLALKEKAVKPRLVKIVSESTRRVVSRTGDHKAYAATQDLAGYVLATTPEDAPTAQGKRVKHVLIEATFPELKGGKMYQSAHGEASGTKPAIARAFRELLKKVPGKRVSVIQARISITTKTVEG